MTTPHTPPGRQDHSGSQDTAPTTGGNPNVAPYHASPGLTLYTGDALDVLRHLPTGSVDCTVTSPPYWRLHDYRIETSPATDVPHVARGGSSSSVTRGKFLGESTGSTDDESHGLEPTATAYIDRLRAVFTELRRVLAPTGTAWLNLGDSYAANSDGYRCAQPGLPRQPRSRPAADIPHENLLGMPWRVALALQADGWILRNAIVWYKPGGATPTPAADRLARRHELLFLLVKQPRYFFDLDAIREPYTGDRTLSRRTHRGGTTPRAAQSPRSPWPPPTPAGQPGGTVRGRNPGDVWAIPTEPTRPGCPPAFPTALPLRCIAAGCPPGGVVLDPFSGTGTTGLAARQLGRSYVGIDLNPAFHDIATSRAALLQPVHQPAGHGTRDHGGPHDQAGRGAARQPSQAHGDRRDQPWPADPAADFEQTGRAA